jgi:hypothetical protein
MNRRKRLYEERKAAGVCTECGKNPPSPRSFKCATCLSNIRLRARGTPGRCHYSRTCPEPLASGKKYCQQHLDLLAARTKGKRLSAKEGGPCAVCGQPKNNPESSCEDCRTRHRQQRLERLGELRDLVYTNYGGYRCRCCGETLPALLTLDHINSDGAEHRRELGGNQTAKLYRWIIENGFPPLFQILCWNCNIGRHLNGGRCPHQDARTATSSAVLSPDS